MRIVEDVWRRRGDLPRQGVGTVGNFDGVHLGQRAVIRRVVERARELDTEAVLVTFEPHPMILLRPEEAPPRLTTRSQKEEQLASCGVDAVVIVDFDRELAATPARDFVEGFLLSDLDLREIYVGANFVFGRDRAGDLALLQELAEARGRRAEGVAEVDLDGGRVSSTRIRAAIRSGDVGLAARLLGRPYRIRGLVVPGARQGRGLGFPTLNLESENELPPARGVYTSWAEIDGVRRAAVTNIGVRPTLYDDSRLTIETHLLDFEGDLYGRQVDLDFVDRLRDERRFAGVDELVSQIAADVARARALLKGAREG